MNIEVPTPQTTLVVLLGASVWPRWPDLNASETFTNSATGIRSYLLDPQKFHLPQENLLDLFDSDQSADDIDDAINQFLNTRIIEMKDSYQIARDILVYFIGHAGFAGDGLDYYLAIRRTRKSNPETSGLRLISLAKTVKENTRHLRRILILDCCYAAAAFNAFQGAGLEEAVKVQALNAFRGAPQRVDTQDTGWPGKGTTLLCSSGRSKPSLLGEQYTEFSGALLHVLNTGAAHEPNYLSLHVIADLIRDFLDETHREVPRPELHSPDQSEGNIAFVPIFPNLAVQKPKHGLEEDASSPAENGYIGKQIGNYSLLIELGRGSYGHVYRAKDNTLPQRSVAVKIMHTAHLESQEKQNRFLQEANLLRSLHHSYILPFIDAGIYEGLPYIVTEYASHGSLRELLDQHSAPHPLPVEQALSILSEIGGALDYAHQHDVIHRDLKPENILFDATGKALLADFNTATVLTTVSKKKIEIAGTPPYMAPEQFLGDASKKSDQYALACIAYELFTGHTPFVAESFFSWGLQHWNKTPPHLTQYVPQLPLSIESAVLKALEKDTDDRHSDISVFIAALQDQRVQLQDNYPPSGGFTTSNYLRRLPVYFLLDCSQSMAGDPITAVNEGVTMIHRELMNDPQALETVYISIITFATRADQYQLIPINQFRPPILSAGGARAMGEAFRLLVESIKQDLVLNTPTQYGDYRPLVFLLTDGEPTDNYRDAVQKLHALRGSRKPTIIALGCGSWVNTTMLHEVTENVYLMPNVTPATMKGYFQWLSGSIVVIEIE